MIWKNLRQPFTLAAAEARFDRRMGGTDTGGFIPNTSLAVPGATAYAATAPTLMRHLLRQIPNPAAYSFVDMGAGKGRALLLAAEHGFRQVIGVELSHDLCAIARRNAAIFARRHPALPGIDVWCEDATTVVLPAGPCVLYFYRPFIGDLAECAIRNVIRDHRSRPRPITIIYYAETFPDALADPIFVGRSHPRKPRDRMERFREYRLKAGIFSTE